MKAKTKRRITHLLTKKKLVKRKTSRHVLRTFIITLATISTGSLAYAITITKPTVSVAVHGTSIEGRLIAAPTRTPGPTKPPGSPDQSGKASWYALGLPEPDAITCASRTFPRGSYLQVKNLRNGRIVVCRVNDYGPEAWTGRVIDLSRGSFVQIDSLSAGTAPVEIRVVPPPTGITIPIANDIAQIIGYNLCRSQHPSRYCELHKQD